MVMKTFSINICTEVRMQSLPAYPGQQAHMMPMPIMTSIPLNSGQLLFIVGANGTGKSTLMGSIGQMNFGNSKRVLANRTLCFDNEQIGMASSEVKNQSANLKNNENNPDSRWQINNFQNYRAKIDVNEVILAEANLNSEISQIAREGNVEVLNNFIKQNPSLIKIINEVFEASNLKIKLKLNGIENISALREENFEYSIARMSDGERNAFIIASNILTAEKDTLILLDEPERHLHKSIVVPLLANLMNLRKDCAFVISTHELDLPLEFADSKILITRNCNRVPMALGGYTFEIEMLETAEELPDSLKLDIIGSRKKVLFIEGEVHRSLDSPLYSLLFPNISIIPKGSSKNVFQSVIGIRSNLKLNWVEAFGLIDRDGFEGDDEISSQEEKGIFRLDVYSSEAIYYNPKIMEKVAARNDLNYKKLVENAIKSGLTAIEKHKENIVSYSVERHIWNQIDREVPKRSCLLKDNALKLTIDIASIRGADLTKLSELVSKNNFVEILKCYPVRESSALSEISKNLGFASRKAYEAAVINLISQDEDAKQIALSLTGNLMAQLS
ncbi:AAA family ATPase [Pseudaquidulcibacter saccharophilus]|uniref:AAA family ATPase n=1 Tax=Pseudaquidulcibacter saccharophilus TaxID=2831900 RepID=UPI001EFEFB62|nr:AAA family ATPase [Pseudaquidulcibacter saccharophilus]